MQLTIDETLRRREKQIKYNTDHHITPKQIVKNISLEALQQEKRPDARELCRAIAPETGTIAADPIIERMTRPQLEKSIAETKRLMQEAAKSLQFLQAAQYRDEIIRLEKELELKES